MSEGAERGPLEWRLDPRRVAVVLAVAVVILVTAHIAAQLLWRLGDRNPANIRTLSDLDSERSVVTWLAALALLACAALLTLVARDASRRRDRMSSRWWFLAALFVVLAVDEFSALHERLDDVVAGGEGLGGSLRFEWVVIGIPFVAAVAAVVLGLLRSLDRPTRRAMILAAALFVGGALGLEMVGASLCDSPGCDEASYQVPMVAEETAELAGTSIFLVSLLRLLDQREVSLKITVDASAGREAR